MYTRKPRQMNELLQEFMKRFPKQKQMQRGMVLHLWPEVVGKQIETATKSLRFNGDTLVVTVHSEAWRFELHANRYSIAKKLNTRVKSDIVKEIIVRT